MSDLKSHQTQPLAPSARHPKSDHVALQIPYHRQPPPKPAGKCFFYTFFIFVVLCLLLLVFALVVLRPKPLPLRLSSPVLRSLSSDPQSPAFRAALSATVSIKNPNFGPLRLRSQSISLLRLGQPVGSSGPSQGNPSVAARGERAVKVDVTAAQAAAPGDSDEEMNRLRDELNSGVLALKAVVEVTGDVVLFGRIHRRAAGGLECDVSIDLRSQRLLSFVCT